MKLLLKLLLVLITASCLQAQTEGMVPVPAGTHNPFIKQSTETIEIKAFFLDARQVTNREFLHFVQHNPKWAKENTPRIFADADYLSHWNSASSIDHIPSIADAPVVNVSWFAARAFCEWNGKRLPTTNEWEYAASALPRGETSSEPLKELILNWYSRKMPDVKQTASVYQNQYGIWDMHGSVWEWVSDFNKVLYNDDGRNSEQIPEGFFCGSASLNASDAGDYASFVRHAFRGSLKGNFTVRRLGFRCAAPTDNSQ